MKFKRMMPEDDGISSESIKLLCRHTTGKSDFLFFLPLFVMWFLPPTLVCALFLVGSDEK